MAEMDTPDAPGRPLDAESSEPLHVQLSAHLRAQIMNHSLPPGTSLPSEVQLQVHYGVSRSVVRQALSTLAVEGLLERGRGRGSTVAPRREHHRLVRRTSGLSTQIADTGASVSTEVLSLTLQNADASTSVLGTPQVLSLERLRTVDGVPIAVIHTWLPAPAFSALTAEDLHNASLHTVLGEKFKVRIASGKRQIRAVPGDRGLLALLQLNATSSVLLLEGTSCDQDGSPVEVFSTWHHPDHVVFDIDIQHEPADLGVGAPKSPTPLHADDAPTTVADRARYLSAELLRFADELSDRRCNPMDKNLPLKRTQRD